MDANYDEDLSENPFLQELRKAHESIFQQVIEQGWIICIPRNGSFVSRRFQKNEVEGHILIPRQDPSVAQFDTLNGKEILFVDRILTVKRNNAEKYSSRLLFEETFYSRNSYKYRVWCVEHPLEESMYTSDSCVNMITNLQEAINFLQIELMEKGLCNNLEAQVNSFLHINKDLDCESVQALRDIVHKLYMDCLRILLENALLKEKILSSKHYHWNIKVSLETYILYTLRNILLKSLSTHTSIEDALLNKIIRNLNEVQSNDLRIRFDLQSRIQGGKSELSRLDCFATLLGKIGCLKRTVNYVSRGVSSVSSDDLLPLLVILVIKSDLSNWIAQLTFMKQFRFSTSSIDEADEAGFLVTSLEAAIEHIKSGALKDFANHDKCKKEREFSSERVYDNIGQTECLSVNYLFACIKKGDLPEVGRILVYDNFDKTNDICHPLCACTSCEQNWTEHKDINACFKDDKGLTPLHIAVSYNQIAIVDLLLDRGPDINITDYDGLTALHRACITGHQSVILQLLHANADPTMIDKRGDTPLHLAADRGHEGCLKALLYLSEQMKLPADVNAVNANGDTPLHLAAKWGYSAIVRVLLECGANCQVINKKGRTPLTMTHSRYIAELIECNVASNVCDDVARSRRLMPLQCTTEDKEENDRQRIISRLLAAIVENDVHLACYYLGLEVYRGIRIDTRADLCHPLCNCKRCSVLEESLQQKRKQRILTINACNNIGETALHVASATGRTEMVQLLLDAGANVNVVTSIEGRTPLHLACLNGSVNVVKLLLNCATCDIDAKDHDGDTPLHLVTKTGNVKLVGLLIRYGANTSAHNLENITPLQLVEEITVYSAAYTDILKILKQNSTQSVDSSSN